jgi:hypothetical protein
MLITLDTLQAPVPTERHLIQTEIDKFESWLEVPSVIASGRWAEEIHTKIDRLRGQLAAAQRPVTRKR